MRHAFLADAVLVLHGLFIVWVIFGGAAVLARQFGKEELAQVMALVNELFDRDWKEKASQEKKPERAFETYTRPSRKNLH